MINWTHHIFINLICCLLGLSQHALATSDEHTKTVSSKKIVLCGHPDYPPVSWAEGGRIVGLAPEIVKQIFNRLDYDVDAKVVGNWKRCLRELELGRVDVAVAYKTQERENIYDFSSQSVIDDPTAIFVNRSRPFLFEHWDDLLGKTTGLMLGDSVGNALDKFLAEELIIERVSKASQNFGKLKRGHIDFIPYGLHTGNLIIQRFGLSDSVVALPNLATTNQYYLAVSRKSDLTQYLELIDIELKKMHDNGNVQRLTGHYIKLYSSKLR